jgi:hypothetical protein
VPPSTKIYVYNNSTATPATDAQKAAFTGETVSDDRHPVLTKIRGWFSRRGSDSTVTTVVTPASSVHSGVTQTSATTVAAPMTRVSTAPAQAVMTPTTDDYAHKLPMPSSSEVMVVTSTGSPPSTVSSKSMPMPATSPILPGNVKRVGRDDKFEWVTGQLEIEKGQYVLYYATPETVDTYHGRIQLNPQQVDMRNFHNGDLISVHGRVHTGHGNAIYQLTSADLIERAKK